jgi:hypothetical protein
MPTALTPTTDTEPAARTTFALELRNVSKRFGLVQANQAVDLQVRA